MLMLIHLNIYFNQGCSDSRARISGPGPDSGQDGKVGTPSIFENFVIFWLIFDTTFKKAFERIVDPLPQFFST